MIERDTAGDENEAGLLGGRLLGQMVRFSRLLRLMGVSTAPVQVMDLARALEHVPVASRIDFYFAARALLVSRHEDQPVFDQAFELFWRGGSAPSSDRSGGEDFRRARLPGEPGSDRGGSEEPGGGGDATGDERGGLVERIARYSPMELLRHKDFAEMSWEEIQAARHAICSTRWSLARRKTRRYRRGRQGRLDLRDIVRRGMASGGEMLELSYRARASRPRPLVVLCDVSGSMDRYSRMLLHFIHAFMHGLTSIDVEAFVFGTRLTA